MILEFKNASIGYHKSLINNINTTINLGEICLIIGNNGVGKTTLIKSILNQIPTISGEILLDNKNIKSFNNQEIAQKIAIVFSKANIPQNYKIKDLIALGKYIHYPYYFDLTSSDKQEVKNIIKDLSLEQYQDFTLNQLSDGNLQKAFIGRALAQNSPIIILDEPTTYLDETNKIMLLNTLRNLAKKYHKLILFTSHDWRLAKDFVDKIWFIKNQQLFSGLAEDILKNHRNNLFNNTLKSNYLFIKPQIFAPDFEQKLLISVLQKNFDQDFSSYHFTFHHNIWEVQYANSHHQFKNFEEIIQFLSKPH